MKVLRSHFRFLVLALSLIFSITVSAAQPALAQSKDDEAKAKSDNTPATETLPQAAINKQPSETVDTVSDAQNYRSVMQERQRQVQQAQQESYKRHIERRKQYLANRPDAPVYNRPEMNNRLPAHIQERRNEFFKRMEERRSMNVKMMEQNRNDAVENKAMQLKMQDNNATESVKKM